MMRELRRGQEAVEQEVEAVGDPEDMVEVGAEAGEDLVVVPDSKETLSSLQV